jgi:hypothetical protein
MVEEPPVDNPAPDAGTYRTRLYRRRRETGALLAWVTAIVGLAGAGCGGTRYALGPAARAGGPPDPIIVEIGRVGVTKDLSLPGAALRPESQVAVELVVSNADPLRPAVIGRLGLVVRDVLGGPEVFAGPVDRDQTGLVPPYPRGAASPMVTAPFTVGPEQAVTVWAVFAGFPPDGPSTAVRAKVLVPVDGHRILEVAIADPVPGGPRWYGAGTAASYLTSGVTEVGARDVITAFDLIGFSYRHSHRRLAWGFDDRITYVYRDALAAGPPALGVSLLGELQVRIWRALVGYAEGGALFGFESPPAVYAALRDVGTRGVLVPRVSAGIVLAGGGRLLDPTLFPAQRPESEQRRFAVRFGYARWFNTGGGRTDGIQLSFEAAISP